VKGTAEVGAPARSCHLRLINTSLCRLDIDVLVMHIMNAAIELCGGKVEEAGRKQDFVEL
jgi:hypothetical protein